MLLISVVLSCDHCASGMCCKTSLSCPSVPELAFCAPMQKHRALDSASAAQRNMIWCICMHLIHAFANAEWLGD